MSRADGRYGSDMVSVKIVASNKNNGAAVPLFLCGAGSEAASWVRWPPPPGWDAPHQAQCRSLLVLLTHLNLDSRCVVSFWYDQR